MNRKPKLQMARRRAVCLAEQQGAAARQVAAHFLVTASRDEASASAAAHFLVTASGDAAAASAAVTEWSSKPLVQWLAHHAGDADGARVAIDMFSDGGVFYGGGVFEAGKWYPARMLFARGPALAAMAF